MKPAIKSFFSQYELNRSLILLFLIVFVSCFFAERSLAEEIVKSTKVAKGGGLDPTKKKIFVRSEYKKLENNTSSLIGDALFELPITPKWFMRVATPFKRNTALSGGSNFGLGDITTRISYLAINTSDGKRLFFGMENKWDTATDTALGLSLIHI